MDANLKIKRKENSSFHGKKDVPIPGIHPGAAGISKTQKGNKDMNINTIDLYKKCHLKSGNSIYPFIPYSFSVDTSYSGRKHVNIEGELTSFDEIITERSTLESSIDRVIFNDPATIVIWKDKTKTVVKCQPGDTYDKEKGLALCIAKKHLGNKGSFNKVFKKHMDS